MFKHGMLKVAAATPKIVIGDPTENAKRITNLLNHSQAAITVFPELTITGYSLSDLFYQESVIKEAMDGLDTILKQATYPGVYILGIPLNVYGILYNCAVVCQKGQVLGVVPKHYLPNDHEFYEKRWFHTGLNTEIKHIKLFGIDVPFGYLLFQEQQKNITFGVEICQDLWATYSPGDDMSLNGANLIFNLSASSEHVGKRLLRRNVVCDHSRKQMSAYVYCSCGQFESTSEVLFSNHKIIAAQGLMIKESSSFDLTENMLIADIDITSINYHKRQNSTYRDFHMKEVKSYQYIDVLIEDHDDYIFEDEINTLPFLPTSNHDKDLKFANDLQVHALAKRLESLPPDVNKIVLGVSGGLDSSLALLVSHQAMKLLNRDPKDIIAVTMPSEVTSSKTQAYAAKLMEHLKVKSLTIPIKNAVDLHLKDLDHESIDVTYENTQARIRTLFLMNLSNKHQGFVLGTGDLSEIAMGFMTYNGDQMSMYNVNAGLPKTWVRALIDYHGRITYPCLKDVLKDILDLPVSPELLEDQKTEDFIGRYDINDFILYHHIQNGAYEDKIEWLIQKAFKLSKKEAQIYVKRFFKRFYTQQFKRQTMPEGPKILNISLSPRGEYRMPSDIKRK
jgi:NAD+ synthase (glutamine-hydrolysing)